MVTQTATGSTASQRVHTVLTIGVDRIEFEAQEHALHISGRVREENRAAAVGAHHTLDLALHRNFTLSKLLWDSVALQTVNEACGAHNGRGGESAAIAAITLHAGLACICAVGEHVTVLRQRIEMAIPRKRGAGANEAHERGLERFYAAITEALLRLFDVDQLRVVLLAGPGFYPMRLRDHVFAHAARTDNRALLRARPRFLVEHASSGHRHALSEALLQPAVRARLADTRYARETAAIDRFLRTLHADEQRAWYGRAEVARAADRGAVGTLLLSDTLFRSPSVAERRRWVAVKEAVERQGGQVLVLSSLHESGVRLDALGGVAAILTYPLDDLDEGEDEGEGEGEDGDGDESGDGDRSGEGHGDGGDNGDDSDGEGGRGKPAGGKTERMENQ